MNRSRLRDLARAEHIRDDAYSLDGVLPDERYVLELVEGGWCVYYSERGHRTGDVSFDTADEACAHLLDLLVRDSTTRVGRRTGTSE
jgi:hypothetical protein